MRTRSGVAIDNFTALPNNIVSRSTAAFAAGQPNRWHKTPGTAPPAIPPIY